MILTNSSWLLTGGQYPIVSASWLSDFLDGLGKAISTALSGAWKTISDLIWDSILKWIKSMIEGILSIVITMMSKYSMSLFSISFVQALLKFFQQIGWAFFIVGSIIAIFDICVEYQTMKSFNLKRQVFPFLLGFMAVNLYTTLPIALYNFCCNQQGKVSTMLSKIANIDSFKTSGIDDWSKNINITGNDAISGLLFILISIAIIYVIIKVFFANIKRGGILLCQMAVGTLYMISIPRGYTDGFWNWCKQVIGTCITAFLQNILLFLGLLVMMENDMIIGLGVMLAANEVPRIAGMFGVDTSAKANMGQVVYNISMATNVIRNIASAI